MLPEIGIPDAHVALAGAILATGTAAFTPITILWARRYFPLRRVFEPRWGFAHVGLVVLVYLSFAMLFFGIYGVTHGTGDPGSGTGEPPSLDVVLLIHAATGGAVSAVIVHWAHRRDPAGVRCLGLWRGGHGRAAAVGVMSYVLTLPGIVGLMALWPWLLARLGHSWEEQQVFVDLPALSGPGLWLAIVLVVVFIPLFEELLFRSFLQPVLVRRFGDKAGVVLAALLFAAVHGISPFLPIFGLALVLGSVMLRTQRLSAVWAIHALHNGLMLGVLFLAGSLSPQ